MEKSTAVMLLSILVAFAMLSSDAEAWCRNKIVEPKYRCTSEACRANCQKEIIDTRCPGCRVEPNTTCFQDACYCVMCSNA
ncbi:hypothetical protein BRADI_3g14255v3 [Brachypodium distachyon]|uniref:Knottin scorpion toxin-like domain-containing protein n=1 Tax=Brachypodium distachyon TaxID=15368 RepID=A0A2K2CX28_BRADI|nr:hypothetical protein BRADI_3g14255v3 [Brachypodium distachyon]